MYFPYGTSKNIEKYFYKIFRNVQMSRRRMFTGIKTKCMFKNVHMFKMYNSIVYEFVTNLLVTKQICFVTHRLVVETL